MKIARTLLLTAIWVAILPYLGFPYFWKNLIFTITGLFLIFLSYLLYREAKKEGKIIKKTFDNFSENNIVTEENETKEEGGGREEIKINFSE